MISNRNTYVLKFVYSYLNSKSYGGVMFMSLKSIKFKHVITKKKLSKWKIPIVILLHDAIVVN